MTDPISRIEAALARLGAEHEPPQGWEAKVLARTVDRPRSRWWWRWWLMPFPVAATAAVVLWIVRPSPVNPLLAFVTAVDDVKVDGKEARVSRGTSLTTGDVLTARAIHNDVHGALWIYRDGSLELACPRDPQCWSFVGQTIAALRLRLVGDYKIVSLTSEKEIPPPKGDYGKDVAAAMEAGATHTVESEIVR